MTFFSLLYENQQEQQVNRSESWLKFKTSRKDKSQNNYEYVGSRLVKVNGKQEKKFYPAFFEALNLESIMHEIYDEETYSQIEKVLTHFLPTEKDVYYRQGIFKALEEPECYGAFLKFWNAIQQIKQVMAYSEKAQYSEQNDSYWLQAIVIYCKAVEKLKGFLENHPIEAEGINRLKNLLTAYTSTPDFVQLKQESYSLKKQVEAITYTLDVEKSKVWVHSGRKATNYTLELARLLGGDEEDYFINRRGDVTLNSLENRILSVLIKENEGIFNHCHKFVESHKSFKAEFMVTMEEELLFYLKYIDYMNKLKQKGFQFCYPKLTQKKVLHIEGLYDLSLASQKQSVKEMVTSELDINENEHGACITGANQGGKTTFIRGLGQLIYQTALGYPVAAHKAEVFLYERIYTQFAEPENQHTENGKLKEELIGLEETLKTVNDKSLVLINELFASTTMEDGRELGEKTIHQLVEKDATVFFVTHIISLAKETQGLISLVAEVREGERCYRMIRKAVDGEAYTQQIIAKYHLSYKEIKERLTGAN